MIERETVTRPWPMGEPTPLHALREQATLVRGWTQLLTRYAMEGPGHEAGIRKGLTRIDAATAQLTELLPQVVPSGAATAPVRVVK